MIKYGMLWLMKRIGIDFGTKKVGIAITDDSGVMAFPHAVVPNDKQLMHYLEQLITARGIKEIVIGHSLNNKGADNQLHSQVMELVTDLTLSLGIPVHLEPEQYSTQQAINLQGRNKKTDATAAAIILDSFITKQNNQRV